MKTFSFCIEIISTFKPDYENNNKRNRQNEMKQTIVYAPFTQLSQRMCRIHPSTRAVVGGAGVVSLWLLG